MSGDCEEDLESEVAGCGAGGGNTWWVPEVPGKLKELKANTIIFRGRSRPLGEWSESLELGQQPLEATHKQMLCLQKERHLGKIRLNHL